MLIINARVETMEERDFENGFVRIKNGKIAAVGDMSALTAEEKNERDIFDAKGGFLMPGIIDAHSHIGMWEDGLSFEGDDGNETTDPSTPHLRAIDAVNAQDFALTEALDGGITTVVTGPGSANPVGGQFVAMKTAGVRIDDMVIKEPAAFKFALGENPKFHFAEKGNAPKTRMATAAIIRETLAKAAEYADKKKRSKKDDKPEYDAKCEALLPLLRGEVPAQFHAHRVDDIFTAIRIAKEFKLRYILTHCTEGHLIAKELGREKTYAIVGPSLATRSKPELKNLTFKTAGELARNGVLVALTVDHPVLPQQFLPLCAALSVKAGMDGKEALRAITINPAIISGLDGRVGSIKVGKDADLVLFDTHPFDLMANVKLVTVNGKRVRG